MNIDSYRRRRKDKDAWTIPSTDEAAFLKDSFDLLERAGNRYKLAVAHGQYGPARTLPFIRKKLPALLASENPGTSIVVASDRTDGAEFAFQRIQTQLRPANTEGSPAIDLIHPAVVNEFGPMNWGLFSVGIYVNKPGEHGAVGSGWRGNAEDWEFSDSQADTAESDRKLDDLAKWLAAEQPKGLPVGGMISQGEWWSPTSAGWQPYRVGESRFLRHFTHLHLSGSPERVPGWI